jgi:hypothetical protein
MGKFILMVWIYSTAVGSTDWRSSLLGEYGQKECEEVYKPKAITDLEVPGRLVRAICLPKEAMFPDQQQKTAGETKAPAKAPPAPAKK